MDNNPQTVGAPPGGFVADAFTLYNWLGTFWQRIYQDSALMKATMDGTGVETAQLYLDFMEAIGLLNRNNVPAYHRERWHYATIKQSEADTGNAAALKLGMSPTIVIGPQTDPSYPAGAMFKLGGNASYSNVVAYPLHLDGMTDVITCITSNIARPAVVLVRDRDFVISGDTVFFTKDNDPFLVEGWSRKPTRDDVELALWCCDMLVDRDYVYNYLGSVLNIQTPSSEFYAKMMGAIWTLYNKGSSLAVVRSALGAVLGEPTVINLTERVETILEYADRQQVVTDAHVYTLPVTAVLRDDVVNNQILHQGDFLTKTLRLYETLDPLKISGCSEFGQLFYTDVPALWLDNRFMRARTRFGLGFDWTPRQITSAGVDANGNQRLQFELYGDPLDVQTFWNDFWAYCEQHSIAPATCFQDYLYATVSATGSYGQVRPMEFLLRYFLKYNAMVLVIERDQLNSEIRFTDVAKILTAFRLVIPAHVYLFIVEQLDKNDSYTLDTPESAIVRSWAKNKQESAHEGLPSQVGMTYLERRPVKRWMPACK